MKRYILVILSLIVLSACLPRTNESPEIEKTITGLFDAMSAADLVKLADFLCDDFQLAEAGMVMSKQEAVDLLKGSVNTEAQRTHKITVIRTHIDGSFAWIAYWNEARIVSEEKTREVKWLETAVLRKEKNEWKLEFLQSTKLNLDRTQD
jgi:ketosteroid isomerase-like protein